MHAPAATRPPPLAAAYLAWLAFVVYGSLLPFELRPLDLQSASQQFLNIRWLNLGLGSRLDWLANLLLYLPLGFIGAIAIIAKLPSGATGWVRLTAALLGAAVGITIAVAIEFVQLFFAPRTVSLNDLVAEIAGTVIGAGAGALFGERAKRLLVAAGRRDAKAVRPWYWLYLVAYGALTLFPFDFSTAIAVFDQKLQRGHAGWWWAPVNLQHQGLALVKLAGEALLTVPFGMALAAAPSRLGWRSAGLLGLGVGAAIELIQLFLLSATSQGVSVLSRGIGFALGAWVAPRAARLRGGTRVRLGRRVALVAVVPWLLLAAYVTGWGRGPVAAAGWAERAATLNYLPFYYHYFAGEAQALTSLLLYAALYGCFGVGIAALRPGAAGLAAVAAFAVAAAFEASRLVLVGLRPDPTNALIAAVSAGLASALVHRFRAIAGADPAAEVTRATATAQPPTSAPIAGTSVSMSTDGASVQGIALGLLAAVGVHAAQGHAGASVAVALMVATSGWLRPLSVLALVPILLALSDVGADTGLRWLTPLDAAMAPLLVLALVRPRKLSPPLRPASFWVGPSLLLGLLPSIWLAFDAAAFTAADATLTPLGAAHGLQLAKGWLWAMVLGIYAWRCGLDARAVSTAFGRGMCVALAGVVALTVWERLAFVGPFDFASDYRAPGPFTEIALGGAYIECFLAAAVPFAVAAVFVERWAVLRAAAMLLVLGATYATMVTFSRGGQVVFLAAVGATAAWALAARHVTAQADSARGRHWLVAALLTGAVGVVAATVLLAPYASSRFRQLDADVDVRLHHWSQGLGLSRNDAVTALFGNGFGAFGRASYLQGDPGTRPGMFGLQRDGERTWLRSHGGSLSYLDQRVDVSYGEPLRLRAIVRTADGRGLQAAVCEKDLVQSRQCGGGALRAPAGAEWQRVELAFSLPPNPSAGWPSRPLRFTLFNGSHSVVEVDELSLQTADGRELLRNGSFEGGSKHWLYASDRHLTWHLKNLWLQVFFESGWLGVLAHAGLLIGALGSIWRASTWCGPYGHAFAIALLAFQGVGLIDSVIDSPRFLQLYLSLALLPWAFAPPRRTSGRVPGGSGSGPSGDRSRP